VFQDYALFPHMTVRQHLAFALHPRKDEPLIAELLAVTGLEALQHQKPATLSGGQQQRLALARTLVQRPRILLLDEPLSALDAAMRTHLQGFLTDIQRSRGMTMILVSHDPAEVQRLASRVVALHAGQIQRQALPADFFHTQEQELSAEVKSVREEGGKWWVTVRMAGQSVALELSAEEGSHLQAGDRILLAVSVLPGSIRRV
jgi:molybdate transport system ATP-binding protein